MSDNRVQKLAQAAQVADLLADRAQQLLEALEALPTADDPAGANVTTGELRRLEQLSRNLQRSLEAYTDLRAPV